MKLNSSGEDELKFAGPVDSENEEISCKNQEQKDFRSTDIKI